MIYLRVCDLKPRFKLQALGLEQKEFGRVTASVPVFQSADMTFCVWRTYSDHEGDPYCFLRRVQEAGDMMEGCSIWVRFGVVCCLFRF